MAAIRSTRARLVGCAMLAVLAGTACGSSDDETHSPGTGGSGGGVGATGGGGSGGTATGGSAGTISGGSGGDAGSAPSDASAPDADSGPSDASAADASSGPDGGWPATGPCFGVPVVELGEIPLDGTQHLSSGFTGSNILIMHFVAPASGSSSLTVYEYATPITWRRAWLSEHRCDMTATAPGAYSQGIGVNLYFTASPTGDAGFTAPVTPGKTYYVMVRNQLPNGQPSCGAGKVCDVAAKAYPPN